MIYTCDTKNDNQKWVWDNQGYIRWLPKSDMCVDVAGGAQKQGTPIQLWNCEDVGISSKASTQQFAYMDALVAQCPSTG
jgi:hypothetical protein